MPKAPRATADAKIWGFHKAFSSYFFMLQSNKNDHIAVSTLPHITIISIKFFKSNGIKNREVPYWQKLLQEDKVVKLQVVLKVEFKEQELNVTSNEIFKHCRN